jgi:hypothetical protein
MGASVAGQPFFSPFQSLLFLLHHFLPHSRLHQQRCLYRQTHMCAICCQIFSAKSMPKCCVPCLLQLQQQYLQVRQACLVKEGRFDQHTPICKHCTKALRR